MILREVWQWRRRMRVIIVDDVPLIREALRRVLKTLDRKVELLEAANVEEALALVAAAVRIDLALLDLELAGKHAFDLLQELRERYPAIPVVVISTSDDPEVIMQALDFGAMGFIPKTLPSPVLVAALRLVLSGGVYLPPALMRHPAAPDDDEQRAPMTYRDYGLTARQSEVLAQLVQGKPNKLICRELNMAEGTVKIHITAIYKALHVASRTQAVMAVSRLGLKP